MDHVGCFSVLAELPPQNGTNEYSEGKQDPSSQIRIRL